MKMISCGYVSACLLALSCLMIRCQQVQTSPADTAASAAADTAAMVKRGLYLVTVGGCNDCHSPKVMGPNGPEPDPARLLSGHPAEAPYPAYDPELTGPGKWILMNQDVTAFAGPWGTTFGANLTSDDTGIGSWRFEQFKLAMRAGKFKGLETSRSLLPPMPWPNIAQMTDEDLLAVFLYLKSTQPIRNVVPGPIPPAS